MASDSALALAHGLAGEALPAPALMFGTVASRSLSTANRAFLLRWQPTEGRTITRIAFEVITAAGSDDACDVGIYNATTLARLGSAGATTGKLNATGVKTVSLLTPVDVQPDTAYLVALSSGTVASTAASIAGRGMTSVNSGAIFCANPAAQAFPDSLCGVMDAAHALPATLSGVSYTATGTMPALFPLEN